ncbi:MAG: hypothetical protein DWQ06_13575 [Calditrichaeota bacterium]|nr:MAG: hypothetical protein DWQ06_13575 [Calditrichota bacterium]
MTYSIISKIASGTFGTVYKVQKSTNGEFYALKLIHENYKTPKEIKRIKRGFETAQKVSHPNCVKMIEWYEEKDQIGFIMEFVDSVVETQNLTSLQEKISKIIQIANGLEALHSKGIVHRDLKPANILETKEGQIKITDFDLVKIDDSSTLTASGAFLGTAKYSSPEQCQSATKVDYKSDLYSLGVLFYQLVCGRVPFDGNSLAEIALAHIRTPLISPRQFVPDLPEVLNTVISKLLKKDPKDRFQSAQEVSKILNTFLKEGKVENLETFGDFLLTPDFVGRRKEFLELNKIYSEVSNGKLKTVLLSGEQGVGKTKLWKEFKLGLTQNSELIFETTCKKDGKIFEPLQLILTQCLEQIGNLSAKEQAEKIGTLGRHLAAILPILERNKCFEFLDELKIMKGIDSEEKVFESFVTLIKNIQMKNQTFVFFFDDLQWIDKQSLKFLQYLTKSLSNNSILLIGTVTKDDNNLETFKSELGNTFLIELNNFSLGEVKTYLTKMFGKSEPVNTSFCEEILRRTSGNVFLIQEIMFHLFETQKLKKDKGVWDLNTENFGDLKLPKSIQSVVNERFKLFDKNLLKLLEVGSLLGKYFNSKIVAEILLLNENKVEEEFSNQKLQGILIRNKEGIFEFENESFREGISQGINQKVFKTYHSEIGNYLEANYPESEILAELLEHFLQASNQEKSIHYGLKLADIYEQQQIFNISIRYLLKILDFIENSNDEELQSNTYLKLGRIFFGINEVKKSEQYFTKASEKAKENSSVKASSLIGIGELKRVQREYDEAFKIYFQAKEVFEKIDNLVEVGRTYIRISFLYSFLNENEKAKIFLMKAKEIGKKTNSKNILGTVIFQEGKIASQKQEYEKAETLYKSSFQLLEEYGDITSIISYHFHMGSNYEKFHKYEKAKNQFNLCFEKSEEFGFNPGVIQSLGFLGRINLRERKLKDAKKYFIQASSKLSELNLLAYPWILNELAKVYFLIGDFEESESIIKKQIQICTKINSEQYLSQLYINYGELLYETKRYKEANDFYEKSFPLLEKVNDFENICFAHYLLSKSCFAKKDIHKAEKLCQKAFEYLGKDFESNILKTKVKIQKELIDFELGNKNEAINNLLELKRLTDSSEPKYEIAFELCKLFEEKKPPYLLEKKINFQKLKLETLDFFKNEFKTKELFFIKKKIDFLEEIEFKTNEIYPELISSLTNWLTPETVFDELLKFLLKETNSGSCQIILKNEKGFEPIAISSNLKDEEIEFSTTVLKKAIEEDKPTLLKNVLEIPELKENQSVIGKIFLSVIAVPLKVKNKVIGALYLDRLKIEKGFFENSDLEKVKSIANILSPVLQRQNEAIKMKIESEINKLGIFVGNSPEMQKVYSEIEEAAKVNFTVYIHGETGTGKELVANSLHKLSLRRNEPFIAINCSAIPKDLAESELFGHTKGSFSGATTDKKGKFELANKGTLFLDEIAELSLDIQAKLLRVIQENEVWKVGAEKPTKIKSRIVIATHKNLEEEVKKGNFRKDLFYRIAFLKIEIPPLRERSEDIIPLCYHFLRKFNKETGKKLKGFTQDSINILLAQSWEGNVRELENLVALCFVKTKSETLISLRDLNINTLENPQEIKPSQSNENLQRSELEEKLSGDFDLNEKIGILEKHLVLKALKKNNFHLKNTFQELGVNNKRLDRLLKKHDIDVSSLKNS